MTESDVCTRFSVRLKASAPMPAHAGEFVHEKAISRSAPDVVPSGPIMSLRLITERFTISRLRALGLLLILTLESGCPHVISLDYVPDNPYQGQGQISIDRFVYLPSDQGRIGPRSLETNAQAAGRFYMSHKVEEFFADAVGRELTHAGYRLNPSADLKISGVIERFYYDPVDVREATVELIVRYRVRHQEQEVYTQSVRVLRETSKSLLAVSQLIHSATKESIRRFLAGAFEAKVLN